MTRVVRTTRELRQSVKAWRTDGQTIGLVPTMGALHEGHLSLVDIAKRNADRVVVTIFVNPTQFAPTEDLATYPRTEQADLEKLMERGADLAYIPAPDDVYPEGFATEVTVGGPTAGLETDHRPHFFAGVATVVTKLLLKALPDIAVFGEKDYQQLLTIKQLVRDLDIPVTIIGGATGREEDGLAMSSRNAYLDEGERKIAGQLNVILKDVAAKVAHGADIVAEIERGRHDLLAAGFDEIHYLEIRDAETLAPVAAHGERPLRILAAVKIGKTRLIDNMPVEA